MPSVFPPGTSSWLGSGFDCGCQCNITATRKDACCNTIKWCGSGTVTMDTGSGYTSVANSGQMDVCTAGPYKLRSVSNGVTRDCTATASRCTNSVRRIRLKLDPINHVNNTTRTCTQGTFILRRFTEYLTRSHTPVDIILDFPYNTSCSALVTFPIVADLGSFSQSSGISGEANTGAGGSFLSYDYSATETWSMKYHYNNKFPNGVNVPTWPSPIHFFEINDYDFSVTHSGWTPYNQTATECSGIFPTCTSAFGTVVDQKVTLTFISQTRLCQSVSARPALGLYACGVRRSKTNARVCSTCTLTDDDSSVADDVLYLDAFGVTVSDIPC